MPSWKQSYNNTDETPRAVIEGLLRSVTGNTFVEMALRGENSAAVVVTKGIHQSQDPHVSITVDGTSYHVNLITDGARKRV